jgi:hypothetical protein
MMLLPADPIVKTVFDMAAIPELSADNVQEHP